MSIVNIQPPRERIPGPMPRNRICSVHGCNARLSSYNRAPVCSVHGGWPKVRMLRDAGDLADLLEAA